jgi:hypothetical protein
MNLLIKLTGLAVLALSAAMILLGINANTFIELTAPRQPDPASGHVIPVMIGHSNLALNHLEYLTPLENTVRGLSYLFVGAGFIGVFGYLFATGKLKKPTSFW